jgi:serine/threonine-protein kinase
VTRLPFRVYRRTQTTALPTDLVVQSARRLRIVVLLYAFVFFMSDPLGAILFPDERRLFLTSPLRALPSVFSIAVALGMAAFASSRRVTADAVLRVGLAFEVLGSYGIAAAQFLDPSRWTAAPPWGGLSWVAVWMLSFTVIIPSPPRQALLAALAAATSVPVVSGVVMGIDLVSIQLSAPRFVFQLVLPYLLVVLIAYVGARIVYHLGTEVTRARELGSYELVERLEQGGMGEVWRARHRLLARPAAIKMMRHEPEGGSTVERWDELKARFEREAQATASLRSPHTVELYDFGVADDGAFYYVMELLDGFTLGALVERFGPVPAERAVHLLRQTCHSLGEAHAAGLVHRDVKPANVFVCRQGRDVDFVKVLDFGLVKELAPVRDIQMTAQHLAGGTPAFMSPEQVLGDRPVDGRSDIYALGCVAYWLVTGELVFAGKTAIETMMQHVHETPPAPSQRTELEIPEALDAAILACLAKNPDDRPASADALASTLASIETPAWTPEDAKRWWDAHHPAA